MQKIVIHTIVDCINYGALLQAYALGQYLKSNYNCSVLYANHPYHNSLVNSFKRLIKAFLGVIPGQLLAREFAAQNFRSLFLSIHKPSSELMKKTHIHIIGSDEVLSGQYYSTDIMRGCINPMSMTLIGYAVTIGNVKNVSKLLQRGFNEWSYKNISCRDAFTSNFLVSLGLQYPVRVCDPTLLLEIDDYMSLDRSLLPLDSLPEKFSLIYSDKPYDELISIIQEIYSFDDQVFVILGNISPLPSDLPCKVVVLRPDFPVHRIPKLFLLAIM